MKKIFLSLKILFTIFFLGTFMFGAWLMAATARDFWVPWVSYGGTIFFACIFLRILWGDDE